MAQRQPKKEEKGEPCSEKSVIFPPEEDSRSEMLALDPPNDIKRRQLLTLYPYPVHGKHRRSRDGKGKVKGKTRRVKVSPLSADQPTSPSKLTSAASTRKKTSSSYFLGRTSV